MGELAAYERRLRRAGLPLLIEDYSAYEDIFTRAAPLLALVFGFQLFGAVQLDWPLAASLVLLTRAVPVLLIFMIVLFINTEMWQVFSDVSDPALAGVIVLFVGLGSVFTGSRLPRECVSSSATSAPTRACAAASASTSAS
jgi:hypothetical protein